MKVSAPAHAKPKNVEVLASGGDLMRAAVERFVAAADGAIRSQGRFVVALSGGSTPKALYALLAGAFYGARVDWTRVHVFWGDERCVPPDHVASNYRMTYDTLLAHVPVQPSQVHRIRGEDVPAAAAAAYECELRQLFATPDGPPRSLPGVRFDLVLLGMGDNGHTASLFPGTPALRETGLDARWVMAQYVDELTMWRVTLTPVVINAAAEVLFLVSGASKATMLRRVLTGRPQPDLLPAQLIAPQTGNLSWLVDAAAAAELEGSR